MSEFWFKPKQHGYGATPTNWRGWAALLVFLAVLLALASLFFRSQPGSVSGPGTLQILIWAALTATLTIVFVRLCRAKTDGQWGWRWGK